MAEPDVPRERPASLWVLFVAFTVLAMQGFGGVIAVAQRELCERRRWLSVTDFGQLFSTAQVLPGPNVCNLALMIGDRFFGWRGACVALAGMITAPLALMLTLAWLLTAHAETPASAHLVQGALRGIAAVAAGQIVGTVLKLAAPLRQHVLGALPAAMLVCLTVVMMAMLRWPLVWVLLSLGSVSCCMSYRVLRRKAVASINKA